MIDHAIPPVVRFDVGLRMVLSIALQTLLLGVDPDDLLSRTR